MTKTNYPNSGSDSWDLTTFDDVTLEHEIQLCRENLYGVSLPEYKIGLKGMMNWEVGEYGCSEEQLKEAQSIWLRRLKNAEDEMFERIALV
jgi:hypothetical protein